MVYTYEKYAIFTERACFVLYIFPCLYFTFQLHESDSGILEHFCNLKMCTV